MPRTLVRHTVRTDTGAVVISAKVEPLLEGTTTPVPDAYAAETGGSVITSVNTNAQGEAILWMDTHRDQIDLRVSSNSTAYLPGAAATLFSFATFTETVAVTPPGDLARYEAIVIAVGDETTAITTGTAKVTFRMPYAMTLTAVRASLTTASSSGLPTVDINEGGVSILSTKLTIDANERTSTTAATAAVISDSALADDAEMTIDIDVAGTGAAGLKVYFIGTRV